MLKVSKKMFFAVSWSKQDQDTISSASVLMQNYSKTKTVYFIIQHSL